MPSVYDNDNQSDNIPTDLNRYLHLPAAAVAALLVLSGCATYRPAPLPSGPDLSTGVPALKINPAQLGGYAAGTLAFNPGDGLDMDETVILAVLNNSVLKAARLERGIKAAQLMEAGLLPDPQLTGGFDDNTGGPDPLNGYSLGLDTDLRALLTRGAARDAARAGARQVDLDILWQEWQVAEMARQLFVQNREQSRLQSIYRDARALYQQRYRQDRAALDRGDITLDQTAGDLTSLVDAGTRLRDLQRQQNQTRHDLAALLGLRPDARPRFTGGAGIKPLSREQVDGAVAALPQRRPDLLALQAGYASQEASVREEILKQFPSINVGVTRARDTAGVRTIGFGVSIGLPLFNRNRGQVAIARATRAQLRQDYQARLDAAAGTADRVYRESLLLQRQLRQVRSRLPELQEVSRRAEAGLRAGNIGAGTYIAVHTQLLDKRAEAVQLESSLQQSRIALQTLLAMPFDTEGSETKQ